MRRTLLIATTTLALGAAACGGSGGDQGAQAACTEPVATTTIDISDFAFGPACIGAASGAALEIHNTGDVSHTFTVKDTSVNVDVGDGDSAAVQLTGLAQGTYDVICTYHSQMTARLTIT
jgi:plastocyanin